PARWRPRKSSYPGARHGRKRKPRWQDGERAGQENPFSHSVQIRHLGGKRSRAGERSRVQSPEEGWPNAFRTREGRQPLASVPGTILITGSVLACHVVTVSQLVVQRPPDQLLPGRGQAVLRVVRPR